MDDDYEAPSSPSLLNTENGDLDHVYTDSGIEESDYGLPSYQQPPQAKQKMEETPPAPQKPK